MASKQDLIDALDDTIGTIIEFQAENHTLNMSDEFAADIVDMWYYVGQISIREPLWMEDMPIQVNIQYATSAMIDGISNFRTVEDREASLVRAVDKLNTTLRLLSDN